MMLCKWIGLEPYLYSPDLLQATLVLSGKNTDPTIRNVLQTFGQYVLSRLPDYSTLLKEGSNTAEIDFLRGHPKTPTYRLDLSPTSRFMDEVTMLIQWMQATERDTHLAMRPIPYLLERALVFKQRLEQGQPQANKNAVVLKRFGFYTLERIIETQDAKETFATLGVTDDALTEALADFDAKQRLLFRLTHEGKPLVLFDALRKLPFKNNVIAELTWPQHRKLFEQFVVYNVTFILPQNNKEAKQAKEVANEKTPLCLDVLHGELGLSVSYSMAGKRRDNKFQMLLPNPKDPILVMDSVQVKGQDFKMPLGFLKLQANDLSFVATPKVALPDLVVKNLSCRLVQQFTAQRVDVDTLFMEGNEATGDKTLLSANIFANEATLTQVEAKNLTLHANKLTLNDCAKMRYRVANNYLIRAKDLTLQSEKLDLADVYVPDTSILTLRNGHYANVDLNESFPNLKHFTLQNATATSFTLAELESYSLINFSGSEWTPPANTKVLTVETRNDLPQNVTTQLLRLRFYGHKRGRNGMLVKHFFVNGNSHCLADFVYDTLFIEPLNEETFFGFPIKANYLAFKLQKPIASLAALQQIVANWQAVSIVLLAPDKSFFPPNVRQSVPSKLNCIWAKEVAAIQWNTFDSTTALKKAIHALT